MNWICSFLYVQKMDRIRVIIVSMWIIFFLKGDTVEKKYFAEREEKRC